MKNDRGILFISKHLIVAKYFMCHWENNFCGTTKKNLKIHKDIFCIQFNGRRQFHFLFSWSCLFSLRHYRPYFYRMTGVDNLQSHISRCWHLSKLYVKGKEKCYTNIESKHTTLKIKYLIMLVNFLETFRAYAVHSRFYLLRIYLHYMTSYFTMLYHVFFILW